MLNKVSGILIFIFLSCFYNAAAAEGKNEVHFLDTGQSDCILIKAGDKNYLIDTGATFTVDKTINYLNTVGVKDIEDIIITHYHDDHYGGLKKILLSKNVKRVMLPKHGEELRKAALEELKGLDISMAYISKNYKIKANGIELTPLIPKKEDELIENNNSIVFAGSIDDLRYIFMGDTEERSEKELLNLNMLGMYDVIKIGHHGLDTSTTETFIEHVKPRVAVITCNGNESPDKNILSRIAKQGSAILRTDIQGYIVIKSKSLENEKDNIKGIEISSYKVIK